MKCLTCAGKCICSLGLAVLPPGFLSPAGSSLSPKTVVVVHPLEAAPVVGCGRERCSFRSGRVKGAWIQASRLGSHHVLRPKLRWWLGSSSSMGPRLSCSGEKCFAVGTLTWISFLCIASCLQGTHSIVACSETCPPLSDVLDSEGAMGKGRFRETCMSNAILPSCVSSQNSDSSLKAVGKRELDASCGTLGFRCETRDNWGLKEKMKSHNEQSWEIYLGTANMLSNI